MYFYREADARYIGPKCRRFDYIRYAIRLAFRRQLTEKYSFQRESLNYIAKQKKSLHVTTTLCDVFSGSQVNSDISK